MAGNFLIDPVDFMKNNLVIPDYNVIGKTQADSGVHTMCLFKYNKKATQHGKEMDMWILVKHQSNIPADKIGAVFEAYWCPYDQNSTLTCMLGTDSRYMFTATMDGCSFGIGSQTGDGSCRVAHSNEAAFGASREQTFGMDGARQFQRAEQAHRIENKITNLAHIIDPTHYMTDFDGELALKSTTFGIRNNNTWEFYTQKYWKNGTSYFYRDTTKH